MKHCAVEFVILSILAALSPSCRPQSHIQPQKHWTETDSETLWTTRYGNCDYGYYVLLGPGVVAHDTLPPSPNHGFLIALPEVTRTSFISSDEDRYIWADASYDAFDPGGSLEAITAEEVKFENGGQVIEERLTTLAGLRAHFVKTQSSSATSNSMDEMIVSLRSDIVYTIGLHTNAAHLLEDEKQFKSTVDGFRLSKLPAGECTN